MSVRRGHISEDKEASERREWYLQLQGKIFDSRSSEALAPINALARNLTANKYTIVRSGILPMEAEECFRAQKLSSLTCWTDWLVKLNKANDTSCTVFVCFHGAGSSPACFKRLSSYLPGTDALIYGVCLPGRMNHLAPPASNGAMTIKHCSEAIFTSLVKSGLAVRKGQGSRRGAQKGRRRRRRLVLIGHCLGALLAFEVGRLLQANGCAACLSALVVASACSPEALSRTNQLRRPPDPRQPSRRKLMELGLPLPDDAPPEMRSMARDDDLLDYLLSEMQAVSPPQVLDRKHDLLKLLLPTVRRDVALMESYRLGNPLLDGDGEDEFSRQGLGVGLGLEDDEDKEGEDCDAKGDDEDEEEEDDEVWPIRKAIFTKVSAPVVMLCAGDDRAVSEQEAAGWLQTSSVGAERVDLPCGGGRAGLFAPGNRSVVADLLLRLCSVE